MADILTSMLASVSSSYDKRPGSFIYDALAPVAKELELIEKSRTTAEGKLLMGNLSGDELALRVEERTGIVRKLATKASGSVAVVGEGIVTAGNVFETASGVQFQAIETKAISGSGLVAIESVIPGMAGNVPANKITLLPVTLTGITAVNNPAETTGGAEAETDESLLSRYYLEVRKQPSSGNPSHYISLARQVPGIVDARVFRAWNGPGTVKVVLLSEDKRTPSASAVDAARALTGENKPINADVTVVGVTEVLINVSATLTLKAGGVLANAVEQIRESVSDYLRSIAFTDLVVRYSKIGEAILNALDVLDYSNLTVNNGTSNIELQQDEVPVIGAVNMS